MSDKNWLPSRLADQFTMFQNVQSKIAGYTAVLPITTAQRDRVLLICTEFISVFNYVAAARATTESLVEWRELIFNGQPTGDPCPEAPPYTVFSIGEDYFIGIFTEFRELVDLIKASPGYTRSIGEDLMIVAVKTDSLTPDEVTPDLKVTTAQPFTVTVNGSLQGTDAMRVEYRRTGAVGWTVAAFLTKTPGSFSVTPNTPGQPETGHIRGVFTKKNADFGNFSPDYPVTLS